MPVILESQDERTWLSGASVDELQSQCKPYASDDLRAYPVSKRVNNPQIDSTDLLEEIDIGGESGLEDLG